MQQCETQLPEKCVRPFGLATLLSMLFIVAQVMMSFHTHDPFYFHEENEPAHHTAECGVCLVASMPSLSGGEIGEIHIFYRRNEQALTAQYMFWGGQSVSPTHARAPPRA